MKKFLFITAAIFAFIPMAQAQTVVDVNGMVCDFCAQSLKKIFGRSDAVESIDVSLDDKTVTIHYKDGAEPLSDDAIGTLIYEAGYDVAGIRAARSE